MLCVTTPEKNIKSIGYVAMLSINRCGKTLHVRFQIRNSTCSLATPPYGAMPSNERKNYEWLSYVGERELMALELCLCYSTDGYFVLPPGSVSFKFSGAQYYQEVEQ